MEIFASIIRNIYPISDKSLNLILPYVQKKNYNKNECIIKAGETKHGLYFVGEGLISHNFIQKEEEIILGFFLKYEYIYSSMYLLNTKENHYNFTLTTIKDSMLYYIKKDSIQKLFSEDREIAYLFLTIVDNLIIKLNKDIILQKCYSPSDRYKLLHEDLSDKIKDIPIKDLASFLSIKNTSLSRIKTQLNNDKITL